MISTTINLGDISVITQSVSVHGFETMKLRQNDV